jgi:hypothetical protein
MLYQFIHRFILCAPLKWQVSTVLRHFFSFSFFLSYSWSSDAQSVAQITRGVRVPGGGPRSALSAVMRNAVKVQVESPPEGFKQPVHTPVREAVIHCV